MELRTFNEWSAAGYSILKGSKATWVDNVAMFSREQVMKKPPRTSRRYRGYPVSYDQYDWDDPWEDIARQAAWGLD